MSDHVKVYGVKPRIQYTANGTSTSYDFPFAIFKTSDINVYFGDTLQNDSNYTVSGAGLSDGGSVVFNSAPASGTVITIIRNLSIERTTDFQEGGTLRSEVLNNELDYQIACQQQIAENLNRSMVLPPYAADSNLDLTLPTPAAGKAIVWNSDGTNLENSTIEVNSLESTLNTYKTQAQNSANTATTQAGIATTQAQMSTTQAGIATTKANEATSAVNQLNSIRTNCILEIPQDIKLVLSSGTLTLKAGSKITAPDGTQTITSVDKTATLTTNGQYMVFAALSDGSLQLNSAYTVAQCGSGSTTPANGNTYKAFFNTTDNKMYRWASSWGTWPVALPIAIITVSNNAISSIDQIFNGFGFVGSTIFALPGVKGLVPNGRNSDGTLNNTIVTISGVQTYSSFGTGTNPNLAMIITPQMVIGSGVFVAQESLAASGRTYIPSKNRIYQTNGVEQSCFVFASANVVSGKVEALKLNLPFTAIDYGDKQTVAMWGLPDYSTAVSISMTSGATKSFTAPYNCFVSIISSGTGTQSYITFDGETINRSDVANQVASVTTSSMYVPYRNTVNLHATGTTISAKYYALHD